MNDIFNALKKLDKYDSLSNRSITRPNPIGARRSKIRPRVRPNPNPQPINSMYNYNQWLRTQGPGAGNIFPNTPQGGDYWQEAYNDYVRGWNTKFGAGPGRRSGPGQRPGQRPQRPGPGTGGSTRMGTPTTGNVLTGRPNRKRY